MSAEYVGVDASNTYVRYNYNSTTERWKKIYTPEEVVDLRLNKLFARDYKRYSDRYASDEEELISAEMLDIFEGLNLTINQKAVHAYIKQFVLKEADVEPIISHSS